MLIIHWTVMLAQLKPQYTSSIQLHQYTTKARVTVAVPYLQLNIEIKNVCEVFLHYNFLKECS